MDRKTLRFDSEYYGNYDVALEVDTCTSDNSLYICLLAKYEDSTNFEPHANLTIDLGKDLKPNEAFIYAYGSDKGMLELVVNNRLGKELPEIARIDLKRYPKIAFDMERLKEFDPEGVKKHLKKHEKSFNKKQKEYER